MQGLSAVITATRSAFFFILLLLLQAANPMPITPASITAAAYSEILPRTISADLDLHSLTAALRARQAAIAASSLPTASRSATPTGASKLPT
eukprot:420729-Pleurochrysis_carterae.AAC.1